ncbi:MAG: hypothetical protein FJ403_14965 [Verrucomicrobia bacterium]|nr:hypothetical protein [Verrucomicrobiota bacterium]
MPRGSLISTKKASKADFLEINFSGEAGLVQKVASRDKLADRVTVASAGVLASLPDLRGGGFRQAVAVKLGVGSQGPEISRSQSPLGVMELASGGLGGASARGFSGTQILHTFGSTKEIGEPYHAGEPGRASSWYTILAEEDAKMLISTEGSDFDTVLAVYEGPSNPLGYDELLLPPVALDNNSGFDRQSSRIVFPTLRNRYYHVAVDGVSGAQGRVVLNYQLGSAPELVVQP